MTTQIIQINKNENGKIPVQLTLEGEQESLNRVVKRFEELKFSKTEKTYVGRKFNDLYDAMSKKQKHEFFTDIWKAIRSSDDYNVFEKYKVKKVK